MPGGFIGVDVFFVISGFLITGLLLREHERSGRVSYARFYARRDPAPAARRRRRARRDPGRAPYLVLNPLDRPDAMLDGASAALSVANVRFALAAGDYFATISQPSPFLHFWSLAVEEQFYLVWPALLFVVAGGGRRRVPIVLVLLLVASFAANLWLTDSATNWAFYSLPGRAWQLAAGGLLAVAIGGVARIPRLILALAGWAAVAGLVASALLLSSALPYPGIYAVAPTALRRRPPGIGSRRARARRAPRLGADPVPRPDQLLAVPLALADPDPARRGPRGAAGSRDRGSRSRSRACSWRP